MIGLCHVLRFLLLLITRQYICIMSCPDYFFSLFVVVILWIISVVCQWLRHSNARIMVLNYIFFCQYWFWRKSPLNMIPIIYSGLVNFCVSLNNIQILWQVWVVLVLILLTNFMRIYLYGIILKLFRRRMQILLNVESECLFRFYPQL